MSGSLQSSPQINELQLRSFVVLHFSFRIRQQEPARSGGFVGQHLVEELSLTVVTHLSLAQDLSTTW